MQIPTLVLLLSLVFSEPEACKLTCTAPYPHFVDSPYNITISRESFTLPDIAGTKPIKFYCYDDDMSIHVLGYDDVIAESPMTAYCFGSVYKLSTQLRGFLPVTTIYCTYENPTVIQKEYE